MPQRVESLDWLLALTVTAMVLPEPIHAVVRVETQMLRPVDSTFRQSQFRRDGRALSSVPSF